MSSVQELLSQINAGQAKRTAAPDKKKKQQAKKAAAAAATGAAAAAPTAAGAAAAASTSQPAAPAAPASTASLPAAPALAAPAPAAQAPAAPVAAKDASKLSDFRLRMLKGGYSGQSPNKPATAAAPGVSLRVGSAAVSLRPGTAAAGAASGPSPPKSKAVPLAKRQKDVQDYLRAHVGDTFSAAEVLAATGYDVADDAELLERLRNPPSGTRSCVFVEDDPVDSSALRLRYRPRHEGVRDKITLLNFIREHPSGSFKEDLDDSYKGVVEDLQALFTEHRIFMIHNPETDRTALFPAELEGVSVDEDIITQYHEVELPLDVLELQAAVQKAGLRSALATQELKRALPVNPNDRRNGKRQRAKRERAVNINKVTNAHLPSLFMGAAPKNIDER